MSSLKDIVETINNADKLSSRVAKMTGFGNLLDYHKLFSPQRHLNKFLAGNDFLSAFQRMDSFTRSIEALHQRTFEKVTGYSTFIEQIQKMTERSNSLYANLSALQKLSDPSNYYPRLQNLELALQGISAQIALKGIYSNNSETVSEFLEVSNKADTIVKHAIEKEYVTKEEFSELIELVKSQKDIKSTIGFWITFFCFILACYDHLPDFNHHIELPQSFIEGQVQRPIARSAAGSFYIPVSRVVDHSCFLYLNPKLRSCKTSRLSDKQLVYVIAVRQKWAYVSYIDSADSLPRAGWLLKKYLSKKKGQ